MEQPINEEVIQGGENFSPENAIEWFDQLIHYINSEKLMISTGIAPKENMSFWNKIMNGNLNDIMKMNKEAANKYFLSKMLLEYIKELTPAASKLRTLFINYHKSQLLVWAEINDDDDDTETNLFKVEGKMNAEFATYGFQISSTIVENSDLFKAPPHYKKINIPAVG